MFGNKKKTRKVQKGDMGTMGVKEGIQAAIESLMAVVNAMGVEEEPVKQQENETMMVDKEGVGHEDEMYKEEMEDDEKKEMYKARVAKEAEETASDDAEDRIEGAQPEESDEAMTMVEKELRAMRNALVTITNVVKSVAEEVKAAKVVTKSHSLAIDGILEGIGLDAGVMKAAEEDSVSVKVGKSIEPKPAVTYQNNDVLNMLDQLVQKAKGQPVEQEGPLYGKEGLGSVMKSLVEGR